MYSGTSSAKAQEAARTHARPDASADLDAGAADLLDRGGEYQPRDAGGDGEGGAGDEADSWEVEY